MNAEDRAALDAWKDYCAAREMAVAVAGMTGNRLAFEHADKMAAEAFDRWCVALDVATVKGGH